MMSGLGRGSHRRRCSLGRDAGSSIPLLRRAAGSASVFPRLSPALPALQPAPHIPCCIQSQPPERRPFSIERRSAKRYLKKSSA